MSFSNAQLVRYCESEQLTFTRSRPYWKNDQAHVEQKNWSVVRGILGYDRYESEAALASSTRCTGFSASGRITGSHRSS